MYSKMRYAVWLKESVRADNSYKSALHPKVVLNHHTIPASFFNLTADWLLLIVVLLCFLCAREHFWSFTLES